MLVRSGIKLLKYWVSVSDDEQERRFASRAADPTRRWKLSPIDLESRERWVAYSKAKDIMFEHTDIPEARWHQIEGDDKRRARVNGIRHILEQIPYEDVTPELIELDSAPAGRYALCAPATRSAYCGAGLLQGCRARRNSERPRALPESERWNGIAAGMASVYSAGCVSGTRLLLDVDAGPRGVCDRGAACWMSLQGMVIRRSRQQNASGKMGMCWRLTSPAIYWTMRRNLPRRC